MGLVLSFVGFIVFLFNHFSQSAQVQQPSKATSPQLQQALTPSTQQSSSSSSIPSPSPNEVSEGWIYIGEIDKNLLGSPRENPLLDSFISPSIIPVKDSIVTIINEKGVNLRRDKPQPPDFNYKNQEIVDLAKYDEKFKVLEIAMLPSSEEVPTVKIWAKVYRCNYTCN